MRKSLSLIITLIFTVLFFDLCSDQKTCEEQIEYPEGGYNYPVKITEEDKYFYCVQLKDSLNTRDSFDMARSGEEFFKGYKEPNLSLKPSTGSTFRIVADCWSRKSVIITLTCNEITLKVAESGHPYSDDNIEKLTSIEQEHYFLLKRYFPLDTTDIPPRRKAYIDSIISVYPQLLSPKYYRSLLDKAANYNYLPLKYSVKKIQITNAKFLYFVKRINASGFWNLPYKLTNEQAPTDGGGYSFEANTPRKYKIVMSPNSPPRAEALTTLVKEILLFVAPGRKELKICEINNRDKHITQISSF